MDLNEELQEGKESHYAEETGPRSSEVHRGLSQAAASKWETQLLDTPHTDSESRLLGPPPLFASKMFF